MCQYLNQLPNNIDKNVGFQEPPQCMPDEFKDECSVKAYWNYYIGEKHSVANANETIITERIHE